MKIVTVLLAVFALVLLSGCVGPSSKNFNTDDPAGALNEYGAEIPKYSFLFRDSRTNPQYILKFEERDWGNGWKGGGSMPCWKGSLAGQNINYFYCLGGLDIIITKQVIDPDGTINPTERITIKEIVVDPVDENDKERHALSTYATTTYWFKQAKIISMTIHVNAAATKQPINPIGPPFVPSATKSIIPDGPINCDEDADCWEEAITLCRPGSSYNHKGNNELIPNEFASMCLNANTGIIVGPREDAGQVACIVNYVGHKQDKLCELNCYSVLGETAPYKCVP